MIQTNSYSSYFARPGLYLRVSLLFAAALLGLPGRALALGADLGDWVPPTPGHNLFAWYSVHSESQGLYQEGSEISGRPGLDVNFNLLRVTNPVHVGEKWIGNPQIGVSYIGLDSNNAAGLGEGSGFGDPFVSFPVFFPMRSGLREYFVVAPFLYLPIGEYDHEDALNAGENRWKGVVQLGYQRALVGGLNLELLGEVTLFGDNDEYGSNKATLSQDPLYEGRAALSYQIESPIYSVFGGGVQQTWGGENEINGHELGDDVRTTTLYLQASTFVTRSDQILFSFSRDLERENGFELDREFKIRYLHIF